MSDEYQPSGKWIGLINSIESSYECSYDFYPPVSEEEITIAEQKLKCQFPDDLREFLKETNGCMENILIKDKYIPNIHVVWPLEEIVRTNLDVRENHVFNDVMPLDHFLFFTRPGVDGILFGYGIRRNGIVKDDIFCWDPIPDDRKWLASRLQDLLFRWDSISI